MPMSTRARLGVSCAAFTCTAIGAAAVTSCSTDSSPSVSGDATVPDTSPIDTGVDTGIDATIDSGIDTGVDTGADLGVDTGVDLGVDAGCVPRPITSFVVPPYVHANAQQFACNNHVPFVELADACASEAATYGGCNAFLDGGLADPDTGPVTDACASCLVTPAATDGGLGPAIQGAIVVANVAGCIEIADTSEVGLSCAQAVQAAWQCTEYACATCPVTDDPSRQSYFACANAAATGVCAAYTATASTCIANERYDGGVDGGGTSIDTFCFAGTTAADQLQEIAAYFCLS
jgi:hypothetical protein